MQSSRPDVLAAFTSLSLGVRLLARSCSAALIAASEGQKWHLAVGFLRAPAAFGLTSVRVCTAEKPWKVPKWEHLPSDLRTGILLAAERRQRGAHGCKV